MLYKFHNAKVQEDYVEIWSTIDSGLEFKEGRHFKPSLALLNKKNSVTAAFAKHLAHFDLMWP